MAAIAKIVAATTKPRYKMPLLLNFINSTPTNRLNQYFRVYGAYYKNIRINSKKEVGDTSPETCFDKTSNKNYESIIGP